MSTSLQLTIRPVPRGLVFSFPGRSSVLDLQHFTAAMESELRQHAKHIDRLIFDLSKVDAVANTAGRILDIATNYKRRFKKQTELRIPQDVYNDLQRISPDELPSDPQKVATVAGLKFIMCPPASFSSVPVAERRARPFENETVLLSCTGKVRAVSDDKITVSLFSDEGEIVGEVARNQFPSSTPRVGQIFRYEAVIKSPGNTLVSVKLLAKRDLTPDEIVQLWKDIQARVPANEF